MKQVYIFIAITFFSACSKNSNRLNGELIVGKWSELINGTLKYGGSSSSAHYHINQDGTLDIYDPESASNLHSSHNTGAYTLSGNIITITYTVEDDTDVGTLEFLDDDNLKITGKADISDPSHIPTVYWRRIQE